VCDIVSVCRNVRLQLDPAKGEHWRPVTVTVPTSSGSKHMAFEQPFTCTGKQHLCLHSAQRCCAGKRHCCYCKKILTVSGSSSTGAYKSGSGTGSNKNASGHPGVVRGSKAPPIGTFQLKSETSAPKRAQKRLFVNLVAEAERDESDDVEGIESHNAVEDEPPGNTEGGAEITGTACDNNVCIQSTTPGSSAMEHIHEGQLMNEAEDVASMLLLFCSTRYASQKLLVPQ
jgi:hypothetical protein